MTDAVPRDADDVDTLASRLLDLNRTGVSYNDMQNRATMGGHRYTASSFEQVAKGQRKVRLPADALGAIAHVLNISVREAADLDDARFKITRDYLTRAASPQDEDDVIANASTDKLLSEIAKRAAANNPDA